MTSIGWIRRAAPLAVSLCLAACGGGDGPATDLPGSPGGLGVGGQVPATAAASSASLVRFLKGLVTTEVDEPLQVGSFDPPRAETAEPEKLD
jgi:hypothetical protein